jgi:hypothetical protein
MKLSWGQGCLVLVIFAFIMAGMQQAASNPTGVVLVLFLGIGAIAAILIYRSSKQKTFLSQLAIQAQTLEQMAAGNFPSDDIVFSTEKDEVVIMRLTRVVLKEFRSNGSSYSGGYGGVSFRVTKGVRANVGGMQGRSQKNPEVSTPIDLGEVTYTNKRIVFTGDNMVREWDLDKIVNVESGPNGVTLEIAVSNREKTSVLEAANFPDLTPGIAASIAIAWHEKGKKGAMADAKEMADLIRNTVAAEEKKAK